MPWGPVFNFRSEGRDFSDSQRCLVLDSVFFEFTGKRYPKAKHRFTLTDSPMMAIAGLWRDGNGNQPPSFTMVTTRPGPVVARIHDRQVVVLARDLGADKFIDYTRQAPEDVVREVDLVVDGVGGPKSGRFLRTLKRGGTLFPIFSLGFEGADEARERGVTVSTTQVRSSGTQLEEIAPLLSDGTIKVVIDGTYLLEQASDAHARAEQGHIQGKIVLTVR